MSNNLESQQISLLDKKVSRRGFLRGLALGAAGLAALKYVPAAAQGAPETTAPTAEQEPLSGWGNLPIVEGEPQLTGELDLSNVYTTIKGVNFRKENSSRAQGETVIQELPVGSVLEGVQGQEALADLDPASTLLWNQMDLVYDGQILEEEKRGYIAQGYFAPATEVPEELEERYRTPAELPTSTVQVAAATLPSVFEKFGGDITFSEKVAKAWGVSTTKEKTFEEEAGESPIRAWQYGVSIAAQGITEESVSGPVNLADIIDGTDLSFYRVVKGDTVDVISRASNTDDAESQDIYIITRQVTDEKGESSIHSVGFATPEGLNHSYKNAAEIAESLSALSGTGVVELVQEINGLDQSAVYLPGMDAFAPKIQAEQTDTVVYSNDSVYTAVVTDPEAAQTAKYMAYSKAAGEAAWMKMYESLDELPENTQKVLAKQAENFAAAYGVDVEGMQTEFKVLTGKDGQPFTVVVGNFPVGDAQFADLYTNIPLVVTTQEEGEIVWERASLANILQKCGVKAGMNMDKDYALKSSAFTPVFEEDCSQITITQGDLLWKWSEPSEGQHERWGSSDMQRLIQEIQMTGDDKEITVQHLLFPEQYPDWVVNGSFERQAGETEAQAYERIIRERITYMSKYNNAVNRWTVVNEPYFNGSTIGENWVRDDVMHRKIGPNYIRRAFEIAREVLGEDEELVYNDTVNQVLSGRQNGLYGQLTVQNLQQLDGLVDIAGMQMHLDGAIPPSKAELIAAMQEYASHTRKGVEITEMDVDLSSVSQANRFLKQAEVYKTVVDAALESGVTNGISFWDIGDKNSWYEVYMNKPQADATLFTDTLQPKPAYFAVMQAAMEHVMQS